MIYRTLIKLSKELIKSLTVNIPIGITIYNVFGYIAKVNGVSMQPSLNPDSNIDYVFLNKWSVRFYDVIRGDVVSLYSPIDPNQTLIKRIIGLEGDIINTPGYKKPFVRVPKGHCWIEGDHNGHSLDSNIFGPVSLALITAKASAIVWPPRRWQHIESELPQNRNLLDMKKINVLSLINKKKITRHSLICLAQ